MRVPQAGKEAVSIADGDTFILPCYPVVVPRQGWEGKREPCDNAYFCLRTHMREKPVWLFALAPCLAVRWRDYFALLHEKRLEGRISEKNAL